MVREFGFLLWLMEEKLGLVGDLGDLFFMLWEFCFLLVI